MILGTELYLPLAVQGEAASNGFYSYRISRINAVMFCYTNLDDETRCEWYVQHGLRGLRICEPNA